jgi:hypothetical protein
MGDSLTVRKWEFMEGVTKKSVRMLPNLPSRTKRPQRRWRRKADHCQSTCELSRQMLHFLESSAFVICGLLISRGLFVHTALACRQCSEPCTTVCSCYREHAPGV